MAIKYRTRYDESSWCRRNGYLALRNLFQLMKLLASYAVEINTGLAWLGLLLA